MSRKVVSVMIVNGMKFIALDQLLVFSMEGSFFLHRAYKFVFHNSLLN